MTKQEIINELSKLYRLQGEGLPVGHLINKLEEKLFEECNKGLDEKKDDEKNKERWKGEL